MATRVKLNSAGVRAILQSPEVAAELMVHAKRIAAAARASAPVETGEYRDSIAAFTDLHSDRVVAHVATTAPHGLLVEAHTGNLARALDAG